MYIIEEAKHFLDRQGRGCINHNEMAKQNATKKNILLNQSKKYKSCYVTSKGKIIAMFSIRSEQ